MASHFVEITNTGAFVPPNLEVQPGDQVTYQAPSDSEIPPGDVVVMCVYPDFIFGDERYVIAPGQSLTLIVSAKATGKKFETYAHIGSSERRCRKSNEHGGAGDEPGGGDVGGDDEPDGGS